MIKIGTMTTKSEVLLEKKQISLTIKALAIGLEHFYCPKEMIRIFKLFVISLYFNP
jgi:hypothetical protein